MVTGRNTLWDLSLTALLIGGCGGVEAQDEPGSAASEQPSSGSEQPAKEGPGETNGELPATRLNDRQGTSGATSGPSRHGSGGAFFASSNVPPADPVSASPQANAYSGRGFIVHEWGTNTVVSASNGTTQLGLHHEEEGLPPFVYDRLKAVVANPHASFTNGSVTNKMETPVLYFYSDQPLTVHAAVQFPGGIFTQWYPGTAWFNPPIYWPSGPSNVDPTLAKDPAFEAPEVPLSQHCQDKYRKGGLLEWGAFELLAPNAPFEGLLEAPLDTFTWSHARQVGSNLIRFPDGERERFLFYRGLSSVALPGITRALGAGKLTLQNLEPSPLGSVFVIDVQGDRAGFVAHPQGVPALGTREFEAPNLATFLPIENFVAGLSEAVTRALESQRLYADEARSMVNTWQRQWFRTPGLRVLYLAPQIWTDQVIPLTLDPTPESLVRVMMVRVEVLTPELEADDQRALQRMELDPGAARTHFAALGRFAEPRLRRALELFPSPRGQAYLAEIAPGVARSAGLGP